MKLFLAWWAIVHELRPAFKYTRTFLLLADGIKAPKTGRKLPAIKKLPQESQNNTKPEFIFGHSCPAIAVAVKAASDIFALPRACRIHEGVVFSSALPSSTPLTFGASFARGCAPSGQESRRPNRWLQLRCATYGAHLNGATRAHLNGATG